MQTPLLEAAGNPSVKELRTVDPPADNVALMFERLAKDPTVDVEKFERFMAMQERILAFNAKAAFDAAFSEMQGELPVVDERGRIVVDDSVRSTFGRHEDIQAAVKPILARHGFSIRHKNKRLENGKLLIIGILSHAQGHREEDEFECPPDNSGKKNEIQSLGSTREYGRRYTTISLLNIVTRGVDDDGHGTTKQQRQEAKAPDGYDAWFAVLESVANEGMAKFSDAWNKSKSEHRNYLASTAPKMLASIKTKAANVKVAK